MSVESGPRFGYPDYWLDDDDKATGHKVAIGRTLPPWVSTCMFCGQWGVTSLATGWGLMAGSRFGTLACKDHVTPPPPAK